MEKSTARLDAAVDAFVTAVEEYLTRVANLDDPFCAAEALGRADTAIDEAVGAHNASTAQVWTV